jgi:hypothetical protein
MTCKTCKGTGKCPHCASHPKGKCAKCGGSGKCPDCTSSKT